MAEPAVQPQYRPTLPELVGARPRTTALGLAAVVAAVVLVGLGLRALTAAPSFSGHAGPVAFSLSYGASLHRVAPQAGEVARFEARRDGRLLESLAVRPLRLPTYRGAVTGELPLYAAGILDRLRATLPGLQAAGEGWLKPGDTTLYGVSFEAPRPGSRVYGLDALALPDEPGARDGVQLTLLETREAGARSPADVGAGGALRHAVQTFALG